MFQTPYMRSTDREKGTKNPLIVWVSDFWQKSLNIRFLSEVVNCWSLDTKTKRTKRTEKKRTKKNEEREKEMTCATELLLRNTSKVKFDT